MTKMKQLAWDLRTYVAYHLERFDIRFRKFWRLDQPWELGEPPLHWKEKVIYSLYSLLFFAVAWGIILWALMFMVLAWDAIFSRDEFFQILHEMFLN